MEAGMPQVAIVTFEDFIKHATSEEKKDVKKVEEIINKLQSSE
jgi:hypothetical protein